MGRCSKPRKIARLAPGACRDQMTTSLVWLQLPDDQTRIQPADREGRGDFQSHFALLRLDERERSTRH